MSRVPDTRDLVGYGAAPPDPRWPGGKRVALSLVLNYEEGGESTPLEGDPASEAYLHEVIGAPPTVGRRNLNTESMFEYGSRVGFWRIRRLVTSFEVPLTVFAVGRALEQNPAAARAMVDAGWEVASHGWRWIDYAELSEEEERGEVVPRHRLGHPPPHAEERRPVDVGLCERDVGARRDRALAVGRGEGDRDHSSHRGAMDEDALEEERVEQLGAVLGPAFDRVPLARARGGAVAAGVEGEEPKAALAKPVVDEAEVVTAEETAAELDHDRAVLGPRQLVVELDPLVDLGVRHRILLVARPGGSSLASGRSREAQSQVRPTRSQATSLGSHSVLIRESSRSAFLAPHFGHGGAGFVESERNSSNRSPHPSQRYS